MDRAKAVEITKKIQEATENLLEMFAEAYRLGVHTALGYKSWEEYILGEFPVLPRLSKLERADVVAELSEHGMKDREIAATLNVSERTVRNDLTKTKGSAPVEVDEPELSPATVVEPSKPTKMTAADERSEIYLSVLRALTKVGEEIARRNAARERPTPAQKQRWQRELSDLITEVDAL